MPRRPSRTDQPVERALGKRTARGFVWLMVQTAGTKSVNLVAQLILAYLLAPEDFDLIALMMTVTMFLGLLRDAGLGDVLVHRHRHFRRWAGAAFWLALTTGTLTGLLTLVAIPLAVAIYQKPELAGLLVVSAIGAPINTLGMVSDALLRIQMRFRLVSMIGLSVFTATSVLTVMFAALGFGAYSWVLPQPIVWLARAVVLWWVARPDVSMKPRFRRWKFLLGDNLKLIGADLAITGSLQGDRAVLGAMFPGSVFAGIYFFALNLTAQSIRLFVLNLTRVLFPALSKLQHEPKRQVRAFLHATSLLALVGVPLCLMQLPMADPLVRLLFPTKWFGAIPVIELLSIGMVGRLMTAPSRGMIMAQGRFGVLLMMSVINAIVFIGLVVAGGLIGGETNGLIGVACAASLAMFLYGPVQIYVAARPAGRTWVDVWKTYALPIGAGVVATTASWFGSRWIGSLVLSDTNGDSPWPAHLATLVSAIVILGASYFLLVALLAPRELREIKSRLGDVLARKRKARPASPPREGGEAETPEEVADLESEVVLPGSEREER